MREEIFSQKANKYCHEYIFSYHFHLTVLGVGITLRHKSAQGHPLTSRRIKNGIQVRLTFKIYTRTATSILGETRGSKCPRPMFVPFGQN